MLQSNPIQSSPVQSSPVQTTKQEMRSSPPLRTRAIERRSVAFPLYPIHPSRTPALCVTKRLSISTVLVLVLVHARSDLISVQSQDGEAPRQPHVPRRELRRPTNGSLPIFAQDVGQRVAAILNRLDNDVPDLHRRVAAPKGPAMLDHVNESPPMLALREPLDLNVKALRGDRDVVVLETFEHDGHAGDGLGHDARLGDFVEGIVEAANGLGVVVEEAAGVLVEGGSQDAPQDVLMRCPAVESQAIGLDQFVEALGGRIPERVGVLDRGMALAGREEGHGIIDGVCCRLVRLPLVDWTTAGIEVV